MNRPQPIEFYLREYHRRCSSREEWVPYSNVLLDAAAEIDQLRQRAKDLEAEVARQKRCADCFAELALEAANSLEKFEKTAGKDPLSPAEPA